VQVNATTVRLFSNAAGTQQVAAADASAISPDGTGIAFADVLARTVRVDLDAVSGTFYGMQVASLAEVEVIAKGAAIAAPEPEADGLAAAGFAALGVLLRKRGSSA
jgi:hypothetical protein